MAKLQVYTVSSLAKVFLHGVYGEPFAGGSLLQNETYSYQIGYFVEGERGKTELAVAVDSPLSDCVTLRRVQNVPSEYPCGPDADDDYLQKTPGLYPDALVPMAGDWTEAMPGAFHALWVTVKPAGKVAPGEYPVRVTLSNEEKGLSETSEVTLRILGASLPRQELLFTQWFHTDCIADYYGLETFGEAHWGWIEKFMKTATNNGMNMILTPVFTPPLDTRPGGERPTTQLVDVEKSGDQYRFGFDRLDRWVETARRAGIEAFEISHLFTQWGAEHAPKIVATEKGELRRIFGWETAADSPEYVNFLGKFLPALTAFLRERGLAEHSWFHVSDEPVLSQLECYRRAHDILAPYLKGFHTFDALSEYAFYEQGLVETPIVATNHIERFLEKGAHPLWAYYCCGQGVGVGNRFFAMPSARNRILGLQLYKFDIAGFLQWGYNFYYTQLCKEPANPWLTTDAAGAFPSGDAFSVYPGRKEVVESLRLVVFHEALQDLRALRLLESRIGREATLQLAEEGIDPITFARYPRGEAYLLTLREKINDALARD